MPQPRRRSRRRYATPVPNLHFWMLIITGVLTVLSMLLYFFSPEAKASQFSGYVMLLMGFLTGKLSNNFGKSLSVSPTTDAAPVPDDEDEEDAPDGN